MARMPSSRSFSDLDRVPAPRTQPTTTTPTAAPSSQALTPTRRTSQSAGTWAMKEAWILKPMRHSVRRSHHRSSKGPVPKCSHKTNKYSLKRNQKATKSSGKTRTTTMASMETTGPRMLGSLIWRLMECSKPLEIQKKQTMQTQSPKKTQLKSN